MTTNAKTHNATVTEDVINQLKREREAIAEIAAALGVTVDKVYQLRKQELWRKEYNRRKYEERKQLKQAMKQKGVNELFTTLLK